ncbi:MAG: histidinol dehydrogenase [Oscillospiraceae bacterium]|nr:histidinol dehydrogenase [Oscillospiraceae bacterium]
MIKKLKYDGTGDINALLARSGGGAEAAESAVSEILGAVRQNGDAAVLEYTRKFDCLSIDRLEVDRNEIEYARDSIDPALLVSLKKAKDNIWAYHEKQKRTGYLYEKQHGVVMGQRITPLERVGVYIPGGTARLTSSVLMNAIPAKIAGVDEIIMATPPDGNGTIPPACLAAAAIAGVNRVFKIGGAQAIAALAYGTQSVPRVDKIVGPGNIYVTAAKKLVYGTVDIDMIAGPSEILIIADETADARFAAADMLGQAEHDPLSASFLITTSEKLAAETEAELERQLETLPRRDIAARAIRDNSAIIITDSLEAAARACNAIAPEHLELCAADPWALMPLIRNAGSIFLGHYAPEALGDYFAGPNHTLPTFGTARFSSPLGVDDFCKKTSFLYYDRGALKAAAADITRLARCEELEAHARSVETRL